MRNISQADDKVKFRGLFTAQSEMFVTWQFSLMVNGIMKFLNLTPADVTRIEYIPFVCQCLRRPRYDQAIAAGEPHTFLAIEDFMEKHRDKWAPQYLRMLFDRAVKNVRDGWPAEPQSIREFTEKQLGSGDQVMSLIDDLFVPTCQINALRRRNADRLPHITAGDDEAADLMDQPPDTAVQRMHHAMSTYRDGVTIKEVKELLADLPMPQRKQLPTNLFKSQSSLTECLLPKFPPSWGVKFTKDRKRRRELVRDGSVGGYMTTSVMVNGERRTTARWSMQGGTVWSTNDPHSCFIGIAARHVVEDNAIFYEQDM